MIKENPYYEDPRQKPIYFFEHLKLINRINDSGTMSWF